LPWRNHTLCYWIWERNKAFVDGELKRKPFDEKRAEDAARMADKDDRKQPGNIRKTTSLIPLGSPSVATRLAYPIRRKL
jgi:hypothetical protein